MSKYRYKAKDSNGKIIDGVIEAENEVTVVSRLQGLGYFPLEIKEIKSKEPFSLKSLFGKKVSRKELMVFTRQLSDLIEAGIPIVKALDTLKQQTSNEYFQEIIASLKSSIEEGNTFYESLQQYPQYFSKLYCGMIKAGEAGGFLPEVLNRLATFFEEENELKGKITASMLYPLVIIFICLVVIFVLITFVIPKFQKVFMDLNQELPWNTQLILSVGKFMQHYFIFVLLGLAGIVIFIKNLLKNPAIKLQVHSYLLKIPLLKEIVLKKELIHFCRILYSLLKNGITLVPALEIVEESVENRAFAREITKLPIAISKGKRFAEALKKCKYFPIVMVNMIAIAEESGKVEDVLLKLSKSYEKEVDRLLKILTSLIEPTIIVIMALIVGFIVSGMILPLLSLNVSG